MQILDIGCGLGQFLLALKKLGYTHIKGIDTNPEAIKHCQNNGLDVEKITQITHYQGQYDFITMMHVLEHLPKDTIIPTLHYIKTHLLKPQGKLFIAVPNAQSNTGCYWAYEDFTHQWLFTAGSLKYTLLMAGFEHITLIDPDCLVGITRPKKIIKKALLALYKANRKFWNRITSSSYHLPSPEVYSYEIKALITNTPPKG
ncbi:hypothetical protein BKH46_06930 [Helicobacter sp. 12S02634-8]|nr:hypothetical protein BKH46_06930 [Helicobacter sp. 12S02634-8]